MALFELLLYGIGSIVFIVTIIQFFLAGKIDENPRKNGSQLKVEMAKAVSKRVMVSGIRSKTRYFVAFELEKSKQRVEFETAGNRYGSIVEGDKGTLSYQSDKFIKFDRIIE